MMAKTIVVATALILAISCTPAVPASERWTVRIEGTDGGFIGGLILELPARQQLPSCGGDPGHILARVVEKHGFEAGYHISDNASMCLQDGLLFADLSTGVADNNLTLSGPWGGLRITGDVEHGTLAGPRRVGRFTAEKL